MDPNSLRALRLCTRYASDNQDGRHLEVRGWSATTAGDVAAVISQINADGTVWEGLPAGRFAARCDFDAPAASSTPTTTSLVPCPDGTTYLVPSLPPLIEVSIVTDGSGHVTSLPVPAVRSTAEQLCGAKGK
jgi:hypothetical protein